MTSEKKESPDLTEAPTTNGQCTDFAESSVNKVNCQSYESVEDTPFATVNVDDERIGQGVIILLAGIPASSKVFKNREEALQYIEEKPWDLITGLILNCIIKNNTNPFKIK